MRFPFDKYRKLAASSLLETIVASVIFMIVFAMAMDVLTRILIANHRDNDYLFIESAFSKCRREMERREIVVGNTTYPFEWGEIQVNISTYQESRLYQVEMNAVTREKKKVNYRYIAANP